MKLNFSNDRLLAVMAHPDDAELLCAGTLARAKAEGAAIAIAVMCWRRQGLSAADPRRRKRTSRGAAGGSRRAAEVLGAQLFWIGARDGELFDSYEMRLKVVEIFRRFRPTLAICHAVEDYHADHRAASQIAEAASWFAASRGHVTDSPALERPPAGVVCRHINMIRFRAADLCRNRGPAGHQGADALDAPLAVAAVGRQGFRAAGGADDPPVRDPRRPGGRRRGRSVSAASCVQTNWGVLTTNTVSLKGDRAVIQFLVTKNATPSGSPWLTSKAGQSLEGRSLDTNEVVKAKATMDIPLGHKIALKDHKSGDNVIKYGCEVGRVVEPIKAGEHVHVHNVKTKRWA
jgi:hypothetical protein